MTMNKIIVLVALMSAGCAPANLQEVKEKSCQAWERVGFECIGYEGYQWGMWFGGGNGGDKVWNTLKRAESPGIIYSGSVQKWGDELHVYGPIAINER
jgi:hypothetical protein